MQPYFFPYLGHFALIARCDRWVVFDLSQYTPKSWMTRNRILHPSGGWHFVSVPVRGASIALRTYQIRLVSPSTSRASVLGKLSHYRRRAPHYREVIELVEETFADLTNDSLVALNVAGLRSVCRYLDIGFAPLISSELALDLSTVNGPGDWAPLICQQLGAKAYLNPASGESLFDPDRFARDRLALELLEFTPPTHTTGPYRFEPGLSILDTLMWNPPEQVRIWIDTHALVRPFAASTMCHLQPFSDLHHE